MRTRSSRENENAFEFHLCFRIIESTYSVESLLSIVLTTHVLCDVSLARACGLGPQKATDLFVLFGLEMFH